MSKNLLLTSLILLIVSVTCFGQVDSMNYKFENFDYSGAIEIADKILKQDSIANDVLINVYLIKGTSYYIMQNEAAAKENFEKLLAIDSTFVPSQQIISPKVISFFYDVKKNLMEQQRRIEQFTSNDPNIAKSLYEENTLLKEKVRSKDALIKSIVFPGWGQNSQGYKLKGWLLTSAGFLSLCSSIYFTIDSNQKEKKYLNAIDDKSIQTGYESYNKSYQIRNYSMGVFSLTWLYSIIDVLFFSQSNH